MYKAHEIILYNKHRIHTESSTYPAYDAYQKVRENSDDYFYATKSASGEEITLTEP